MEPVGAISEGEWMNLSYVYPTEEAEFMAQLLGISSLGNELSGFPGVGTNMGLAGSEEGQMYFSGSSNTDTYYFSRGSSYSDGSSTTVLPSSSYGSSYHGSGSIDFLMAEGTNYSMEGEDCSKQEMSGGSMEEEARPNISEPLLPGKILGEMPTPEISPDDRDGNLLESSKKRSKVSEDMPKKRNVKGRRIQKLVVSAREVDEEGNARLHRDGSGSFSSEDESNASQELNEGAISSSSSKEAAVFNSNGKKRASRGSATDPQSLYARKRRERINERLRILQNLFPMEQSTMLEEAVQYVKFLQLQIKLLSSDDLWMYAPLAYNGMDIGLDLKINSPR
ncbi:hypothetical protein NMG60_11019777 [Bertholletia excelsa]